MVVIPVRRNTRDDRKCVCCREEREIKEETVKMELQSLEQKETLVQEETLEKMDLMVSLPEIIANSLVTGHFETSSVCTVLTHLCKP